MYVDAAGAGPAMLGLHGALSLLSGMRGKPRRGMLRRAVFSDFQRKGLEKVFQKQKYISKPDRKKLAEKLGLKDSQVAHWAKIISNFLCCMSAKMFLGFPYLPLKVFEQFCSGCHVLSSL